jgi:hypothetical protein
MSFSVTTDSPTAVLKTLPQIGAYSFEAWKNFNPKLGSWLFGDQLFGTSTTKGVNFKNMKIDATTSKDGQTVEWSTIAMKRLATTTSTAGAGTVKTVASTTGFSKGDKIIFEAADGTETYAFIATVDSTTQITLSASKTTANGDIVKRVASSKRVGGVVDRTDYDPTRNKTSNNFQTYQAKFSVTDATLNSHMDLYFRGGQPKPSDAKAQKEMLLDGINNYLQMKTSQKLGNEIFGDIAATFFKGTKDSYTDGASAVRYYAGGLAEVVDTVTISASDEGDAILEQIWSSAYDVYQYGGAYGNNTVVMVCNAAFKKKFGTLRQNNVQITLSAAPSEFGYGLEKINFPQFDGIYVAYEPSLDDVEVNAPVAYIIPLDLIGAYRRQYHGLNENFQAETSSPDILIKKSTTDEDTMDTTTLLMTYDLSFIFGGNDSATNFGTGKGLYKRIVLA